MTPRDDLFTNIHKALRVALFELTAQAGRTDWGDPSDVEALESTWRPIHALLDAHTSHEDRYILRILDQHDPSVTAAAGEQHRDLDDLLDHLAARFDAVLAAPDPADGLELYRDLARFVAAYLPHLHVEETQIMPAIWASCDDEEIAAVRTAFMADTAPDVMETSMRYLLAALDRPTRALLAERAGTPA
jgi:hypothetical protein